MKPIKLIARGLVSGQIRLTPELLSALRQLADHGDPEKTTVITITEEVTETPPPSPGSRFGKLVSVVSLPPRRRCTTGPSPNPTSGDSPPL